MLFSINLTLAHKSRLWTGRLWEGQGEGGEPVKEEWEAAAPVEGQKSGVEPAKRERERERERGR